MKRSRRRAAGPGRLLGAVGIAILALTIAACGSDQPEEQSTAAPVPPASTAAANDAPAYPLTFTDDSGTTVTIAAEPQRVVAVLPSVTNLLLDLGLTARIVATDDFSAGAHPALSGVPRLGGGGFIFNVEATAALQPDLVLAAQGGTDEFVQQGRSLGWTVVVVKYPGSIEEMLDQFLRIGQIFDHATDAERLVADLRARLDAAAARATGQPPVRVYLEVDQSTPTQPFTIGPGSLQEEVLQRAGGENIFHDTNAAFAQVNWEAIIDRDPEVIFLLDSTDFADALAFSPVSVEEVAERTGWNTISAVQMGRIIPLDQNQFTPGVHLVAIAEQIAEILAQVRASAAAAPLSGTPPA